MDKTSVIFGNKIDNKTVKKATKSKNKYIKKYGDDTNKEYHLMASHNPTLYGDMGIENLSFGDEPMKFDDKAVIIGNIRMGFGHYRISIAMASCAHALGYTPYWLDFNSFNCTGSKMINEQNDMYSLASRISQKSKLFNKLVWEPLNSEGFRQITYNAIDQKNSELLVPICHDLPKDVPYIATHVWPSQAAVHAGLTHVVNAIPDNWPMALHLSEGAIHTVQTPFAYLGYKMLNGMAKNDLTPLPDGVLYDIGHYIDHELVSNLEKDTELRIKKLKNNETLNFLMTIGGAGAQYKLFKEMIEFYMPLVKKRKINLFINFGDHKEVYEKLAKEIKDFESESVKHFDNWIEFKDMVENIQSAKGIHVIYHKDIFQAVYSTNLLMRHMDLMITKPSELAYYPVPKLMIQRVGGHEAYGAIHASEIGDGTFECDTIKSIKNMVMNMLASNEILLEMNNNILRNYKNGLYDGAYKAVKLAVNKSL